MTAFHAWLRGAATRALVGAGRDHRTIEEGMAELASCRATVHLDVRSLHTPKRLKQAAQYLIVRRNGTLVRIAEGLEVEVDAVEAGCHLLKTLLNFGPAEWNRHCRLLAGGNREVSVGQLLISPLLKTHGHDSGSLVVDPYQLKDGGRHLRGCYVLELREASVLV